MQTLWYGHGTCSFKVGPWNHPWEVGLSESVVESWSNWLTNTRFQHMKISFQLSDWYRRVDEDFLEHMVLWTLYMIIVNAVIYSEILKVFVKRHEDICIRVSSCCMTMPLHAKSCFRNMTEMFLSHSLHNSDLAHLNYHLFGLLRQNDAVTAEVHGWLHSRNAMFFEESIYVLFQWDSCIHLNGNNM